MSGELKEECAVSGAFYQNPETWASYANFKMLRTMQHRGQASSGIVTEPEPGSLTYIRDEGLVERIFSNEVLDKLIGQIGVGHNRWATDGNKTGHLQPVIDKALGSAFAHNGNLPDTTKLQEELLKSRIKKGTKNDSEMMGYQLFQKIFEHNDLPGAIEKSYDLFQGGFSCVAMHDGQLIAFRDAFGIRPLAFGKHGNNGYLFASETCALNSVNAEYIQEVPPGHMIIVNQDGYEIRQLAENPQSKLDIFEFVYFARPDSNLYGKNVGLVRKEFGKKLAEEHPFDNTNEEYLVVPVPRTSIPTAEGYGQAMGIEVSHAIVKDDYVQRTFTTEDEEVQALQLDRKHNMIPEFVKDRRLIIIDDSIVKMRTIGRIVEQAWKCGAKEVIVLVGSPPIRFPNLYGVNTTDQTELPASYMTIEAMKSKIGASYLGYLTLSGMVEATGLPAEKFDLSSFNRDYPIDIGDYHRSRIKTPISMKYAK